MIKIKSLKKEKKMGKKHCFQHESEIRFLLENNSVEKSVDKHLMH